MIGSSLLLGLLVVITSTAIAMPLAYLFSRTEFATKKRTLTCSFSSLS